MKVELLTASSSCCLKSFTLPCRALFWSAIDCWVLRSSSTYKLQERSPWVYSEEIITTRKRSSGQGNIFSSVCQEFCPQGGLPQCMLGYHNPPDQVSPPTRQTPVTSPPDQASPQDQTPPCWDQTAPCTVHAGRYDQQVGHMHPTGMQSCYRLQRSWGKVMFLQASVILLTGGCLVPGVSGPRGVPGGDPRDGHCCGRYASYWNAFLYWMSWDEWLI